MFQLVPFPLQRLALIFPSLSFAAPVAVEAHLVDLQIPEQVQVQMGFGFPNPIPPRTDNIFILL